MKRAYKRPVMRVERFVPNEYVAACGDTNKVYLFECNAGNTNGDPSNHYEVFTNDGTCLTGLPYDKWGYEPCKETHEASTTDPFIEGYMIDFLDPSTTVTQRFDKQSGALIGGTISGNHIPVIIWRGSNGDNVHCTENLTISSWETAKS